MTDQKPVYRPPFLLVLTYAGMIGVIWYWGGWQALLAIWFGSLCLGAVLVAYGYYQRWRDGE